jgi:hypothetical protein
MLTSEIETFAAGSTFFKIKSLTLPCHRRCNAFRFRAVPQKQLLAFLR